MIYDCFMFFNEVELLELRLKTLNDFVDKFVLVELNITHTGKPKPYYFDQFKSLFKRYEDKIIHIKDIAYPQIDPWIVENAHRNVISKGIVNAQPEDYIMISDADEIPNPISVIEAIHQGYEAFAMLMELYCYYVNCKSNQMWIGTVVQKKRLVTTPQDIRNNRHSQPYNIISGGWHYSSMGGKERIRIKFDAFAETDYNTTKYMSDENLDRCLETGKDLTDRRELVFQKYFIPDSEITHKEIFEWSKKYPNFKK